MLGLPLDMVARGAGASEKESFNIKHLYSDCADVYGVFVSFLPSPSKSLTDCDCFGLFLNCCGSSFFYKTNDVNDGNTILLFN